MQSAKQYTNQYKVKFKMVYLINRNACGFRYLSTGESFRSLAFSFRMIITQLEEQWFKLVVFCGAGCHRSKLSSE